MTLAFWLLLVLVNGHGTVGYVYSTAQECRDARADVRDAEDVLGLSECVPTALAMRIGEAATPIGL